MQPPRPEGVISHERHRVEAEGTQHQLLDVLTESAPYWDVVDLLNAIAAEDTSWRLLQPMPISSRCSPTLFVQHQPKEVLDLRRSRNLLELLCPQGPDSTKEKSVVCRGRGVRHVR